MLGLSVPTPQVVPIVYDEFENTIGVIRQHNGQKEKGQKDKQRSTKHTYKTKD